MMKLWIDDLRDNPDVKWAGIAEPEGWVDARTSAAAIELLTAHEGGPLEEISFDHDLGGDDTTRPVLLWMIENDVWPEQIVIHTANPVGRTWLREMAKRYAPEWVQIVA